MCAPDPQPATDAAIVRSLLSAAVRRESACATIVSYTKSGRPFRHDCQVSPAAAPGVSRAVSSNVQLLDLAGWSKPQPVDAICHRALDRDGGAALDTSAWSLMLERACKRARPLSPAPSSMSPQFAMFRSQTPLPRPPPSLRPLRRAPPMLVVTEAISPYPITWASTGWLYVCGFQMSEIIGRDLSCIQGPGTDRKAIGRLMSAVRSGEPVDSLPLVNYDKHGRPFSHRLSIERVETSELDSAVGSPASSVSLGSECSSAPVRLWGEHGPKPEGEAEGEGKPRGRRMLLRAVSTHMTSLAAKKAFEFSHDDDSDDETTTFACDDDWGDSLEPAAVQPTPSRALE